MNKASRIHRRSVLTRDIGIIVLSVLISLVLIRTGALKSLLASIGQFEFLGSFIAGFFFTSIFTTAPSIVALGQTAQAHTLIGTAFFGSLGAVLGDLIIFRFVEDELDDHFTALLKERGVFRRTKKIFNTPLFRWLTLIIGGLLLASPLPDEIAISLLGAEKMRPSRFAILSFVFNFIGITIIGLIARSIV